MDDYSLQQFKLDLDVLVWLTKKKEHDADKWFSLNQIHLGTSINKQILASSLDRNVFAGYVRWETIEGCDVYQATDKAVFTDTP